MALDNLSDSEIRSKLAELGHPVGPITETTRKILLKKLGVLIQDKQKSPKVRKNAFKYSSAEESDCEQHGGGGTSRRISMPPPANIRSRWKTTPKSSPLNATIGDFRAANSTPTANNRTRRSGRKSLKDKQTGYDFNSGSDTDYSEKRGNHFNSFSSMSSTQKDSRLFLTNFSKRNDVNDIKETDSDEGPSTPRIYPFRVSPLPIKKFYDQPETTETRSLFNQLRQYGSMAILCLFLLFFIWLSATYFIKVYFQRPLLTGKSNSVYPVCKNDEIGLVPCIPSEDLKIAVALYRPVHQMLLSRSLESVCGENGPLRPYMTRRELVQFLLKSRPGEITQLEKGINHLSLLLISNPGWGIHVLKMNDDIQTLTAECKIPNELKAIPSDLNEDFVLVTSCPDLPFSCRVKLYFYNFVYYSSILVIAFLVIYGLVRGVSRYMESVKEEEQQVMGLVEKILKQLSESCNPIQEYIAIRHVHDMLIRPADRTQMAKLWDKAVQFLEKNESRVRREVQTVHGEETAVWRWLTPISNPPSPILAPITPTPEPSDNHLYPDLSGMRERDGQRVWQGEAFETRMGSMNSLPTSPTPCLKIRHMFQPNKNYGPDWETGVKDAIIEKCDGAQIVHIFVDSRNKEGCVYLKCTTPQDAGRAYGHLHGSWFDGLLVTVRFLRLERYHDRFPDAINCNTPLKPSNDLRLSLAKQA